MLLGKWSHNGIFFGNKSSSYQGIRLTHTFFMEMFIGNFLANARGSFGGVTPSGELYESHWIEVCWTSFWRRMWSQRVEDELRKGNSAYQNTYRDRNKPRIRNWLPNTCSLKIEEPPRLVYTVLVLHGTLSFALAPRTGLQERLGYEALYSHIHMYHTYSRNRINMFHTILLP